jgi:hypothetical protein
MMTPHLFFKEFLPWLLAQSPRTQGTCRITLFSGTRRDWTIDLARGTVVRNFQRPVDLDLEMDECDFADLLDGALDIARAIETGRIRCRGELSMLLRLAALFDDFQPTHPQHLPEA